MTEHKGRQGLFFPGGQECTSENNQGQDLQRDTDENHEPKTAGQKTGGKVHKTQGQRRLSKQETRKQKTMTELVLVSS